MTRAFAKTWDEVYRAHDIIDAILKDEVPPVHFDPDVEFTMRCVRNTLCWLLGHDSGREFQQNLDRYEQSLKDEGYEPVLKPRLQ
jgi:hypothetical protein